MLGLFLSWSTLFCLQHFSFFFFLFLLLSFLETALCPQLSHQRGLHACLLFCNQLIGNRFGGDVAARGCLAVRGKKAAPHSLEHFHFTSLRLWLQPVLCVIAAAPTPACTGPRKAQGWKTRSLITQHSLKWTANFSLWDCLASAPRRILIWSLCWKLGQCHVSCLRFYRHK